MKQTRLMSFIEACTSTAIGYVVAIATQAIVFPFFGFVATPSEHASIAAIFTAVSLARSYVVRRFFSMWGAA